MQRPPRTPIGKTQVEDQATIDVLEPEPRPNVPFRLPHTAFDVVVMAASAGGLNALSKVLYGLPPDFPAAIIVVQHLAPSSKNLLAHILIDV